jgi:hypothetical protein
MGYTTCSGGLSVVKSMCGLGWLEQIYASSCGFVTTGCSAYSPWLCLAGVYSSYLSCLSSICVGTSPCNLLQHYLEYGLGASQNFVLGCCGLQWGDFLCENFVGLAENPIPAIWSQALSMVSCLGGVCPVSPNVGALNSCMLCM